MQASHPDNSPAHGGYYEPPTQLSQSSSRSNDMQKNEADNVNKMHGGYYEPPTQTSQPSSRSTNTQKSDAYNVDRMHGGFYEPSQPQRKGSSHPSEYPSRANVFPPMIQGEDHETGGRITSRHGNRSESQEARLNDPNISQLVQSGTSNRHKHSNSIPMRQLPPHSIPQRPITSSSRRARASELSQPDVSSLSDKLVYSHRDALSRPFRGEKHFEQTLRPSDRRLVDLYVQCTYHDELSRVAWIRTAVRNKSPYIIRLAEWGLAREYVDEKIQQSTAKAIIRWLPACVALTFIMLFPTRVAAEPRNYGQYDAFPYKDWAYPYEAKNASEKRTELVGSQQRSLVLPSNGKIEKTLEPDFLCFLNEGGGVDRLEVSVWRKNRDYRPDTRIEYVVVSFTSAQFSEPNPAYLHEVGMHAARMAGVPAYWVSTSCLGQNGEEAENNVWRICDIIRSAHSLVVAVSGDADTEELLNQWSMRVWTWPELLLSPGRQDIHIYTDGDSLDLRVPWAKRNFAILWDDPNLSGQMIDHFEGSVVLTPLELVTITLQCLVNQTTKKYLKGDLSYALMGLLRQRPAVVKTDNAFQAFARLSLANDSNMLLERLICLLPESSNEPWHSLSDAWGASLWDIYPKTQVCGIGDDDTVIIDGVRGAAIRWKSFTPVLTLVRETLPRKIVRWTLRTVPVAFGAGLIWVITAAVLTNLVIRDIGAALMGLAFAAMLLSPILIRAIYRGKVWHAQPWFFGVEGYMSLLDLELHIFGSYEGKLKWSSSGSPLSRHTAETGVGFEHFCQGQDPSQCEEVKKLIEKASLSEDGNMVFTLVDTYTMTVTLFSAARPPVAILLCGEEGGMQRAVLCSYDWRTSTLYRETVLRMESTIWDKTQHMPRVRLGLRRK